MQKDLSNKEPEEIQTGSESIQQEAVVSREWKPSVRIKKREGSPRQKLRIKDLSPDRQYIKEVNDSELKYFLLLVVPVVLVAIFNLAQRGDIYNRFIEFMVKFFSNS